MRPNIIIHIGPPKTATTSLQIALDEVSYPNFFYAGTFQPRDRNVGSLCQALYRACSDQPEPQAIALNFSGELERLITEGKTVFFSEEMFLLEQEHVSIEDKIVRLREALSGFGCRILISARSGKSALPSFYQEIFSSLPVRLRKDFTAFCRDRRAACYDYVSVCDMLVKSGFNDIVLFDFKELAKENLNLGSLTACDDFSKCEITAQRHNAGLSGGGENERVLPKVSLKSFGGSAVSKSLIKALNMRKWPGYGGLVNILDRIEVSPSGSRNLLVPHDIACGFEASYQEALSRFGQNTLNNGVDSN